MSEWWKYHISDFLLFSPRTYYRLMERYNEAVWPGQFATLALGVVILALLCRPAPQRRRIIAGVVAALWAFVAVAFLWKRYARINWAATYFAWLFAIEAALLATLTFRLSRDFAGRVGVGLFLFSLVVYPLLAPLLGRGWRQAEAFGVAPDPTVLATLGLLLMVERPPRWWTQVVPLAWCLMSGALLWAMGSPEVWILVMAAILVLGAARFPRSDAPSVTGA